MKIWIARCTKNFGRRSEISKSWDVIGPVNNLGAFCTQILMEWEDRPEGIRLQETTDIDPLAKGNQAQSEVFSTTTT